MIYSDNEAGLWVDGVYIVVVTDEEGCFGAICGLLVVCE